MLVALQYFSDFLQNQIGTHFFGHAYLTSLLLPKLKKSSPSRIVWTTSAAETSGDVDWDNLEYVATRNRPHAPVTHCTICH